MFGFRVGNYRLVIIKLKYSRENLVWEKNVILWKLNDYDNLVNCWIF